MQLEIAGHGTKRAEPVPSFLREYRRFDRMLAPLEARLLEAAKLEPGQIVIDVGAGAGTTSLDAAERVGKGGEVLAIDKSARAARFVAERARLRGLPQLRSVCADAETCPFAVAGADAIVSRFGTLHFAQPLLAFDHLRRALKAGRRLTFLCAREPELNAWYSVPAAVLERVAPRHAHRAAHATGGGPFALAHAAQVRWILTEAGFRHVTLTALDEMLEVGDDLDDALEFLFETDAKAVADHLDEPALLELTRALRQALAPFAGPSGVCIPSATWLVEARA